MKISRICVRRLKSFVDYSNIAVELCADLDEGDDVAAVHRKLVEQVNLLIEEAKEVEQEREIVEKIVRKQEEVSKWLKGLSDYYEELKQQATKLADQVNEVRQILEQAKKVEKENETIIDRLKKLLSK